MTYDCQLNISVVIRKAQKVNQLEKSQVIKALDHLGDSRWPVELQKLSGFTKAGVRKWRLHPEQKSKQLEKYSRKLLIRYLERAA